MMIITPPSMLAWRTFDIGAAVLGFAGIGFMAYRRKAKPALMAA